MSKANALVMEEIIKIEELEFQSELERIIQTLPTATRLRIQKKIRKILNVKRKLPNEKGWLETRRASTR